MIITCPTCNKQFKIDNSMIPDKGRDLQCGSCNHVWFYKIEEESKGIFKLKEEIISKDLEELNEKKQKKRIEEKQQIKKVSEIKKPSPSIIPENTGSKSFSYLIVVIISFVALIILLDTLKTPLISIFPGLEILLFNLFETLQDIKLFIIDLI